MGSILCISCMLPPVVVAAVVVRSRRRSRVVVGVVGVGRVL